jgi:hypothetical protein
LNINSGCKEKGQVFGSALRELSSTQGLTMENQEHKSLNSENEASSRKRNVRLVVALLFLICAGVVTNLAANVIQSWPPLIVLAAINLAIFFWAAVALFQACGKGMKRTKLKCMFCVSVAGLVFPLNLLHAQSTTIGSSNISSMTASDWATLIEAVSQTTPTPPEAIPRDATLYSAQNPQWPPFPGNVNNLPAWNLGQKVWLMDDLNFDYEAQARVQSHAMMGAMDDDGEPTPAYSNSFTFDTNDLWLDIPNVAGGLAYLNLHNPTNQVYAIWSATNLLTGWNVETEVWPTNPAVMPFTLLTLDRQNLFLQAEDWTGVTENGNTTPCWWFWAYFGTTALSDTNLDSQGNTLLYDYMNGLDPNVIAFTLSATNFYVNQAAVPVQINLSAGVPSYYAVLVNDTNQADANWLVYTGTNITVDLGSTDGVYCVSVGLRGLPANATQTWDTEALEFTLDTTPPSIATTSPTNSVGSLPMIQLQGYSTKPLNRLSFDVSNVFGTVTNQQGFVTGQDYDTNAWKFTTNYFQCFDIVLMQGTNTITLHATDLAGNTAVTNFMFTLDYSGTTNPPVIQINWPQNATQISGTNFTVQGQLNNSTATITAQIVDAGGDSNAVNGLVERDGKFWVENLPLSLGTNMLTITASDAVGNISSTNLVLIQSGVIISITPVASNQLNQTTATVAGTVSDSSYNVSVNGVAATVDGSGNWTATNVPINAGGTACFNVTACQAGGSPVIVSSLNQDKPASVRVSRYINDWENIFSPRNSPESSPHPDFLPAVNQHYHLEWDDTENSSAYLYATNLASGQTCQSLYSWPPDVYILNVESPTQPGLVTNSCNVNDTNSGPPQLLLEQCSLETQSNVVNGVYVYTRSAQTFLQFQTGGKSLPGRRNLFNISTIATLETNSSVAIPPQQLNMGALGGLDTNNNLNVVLPNGVGIDMTPHLSVPLYNGGYNYSVNTTRYVPGSCTVGVQTLQDASEPGCIPDSTDCSVGSYIFSGQTGYVEFTRAGDTQRPLWVTFGVSGTAGMGLEYDLSGDGQYFAGHLNASPWCVYFDPGVTNVILPVFPDYYGYDYGTLTAVFSIFPDGSQNVNSPPYYGIDLNNASTTVLITHSDVDAWTPQLNFVPCQPVPTNGLIEISGNLQREDYSTGSEVGYGPYTNWFYLITDAELGIDFTFQSTNGVIYGPTFPQPGLTNLNTQSPLGGIQVINSQGKVETLHVYTVMTSFCIGWWVDDNGAIRSPLSVTTPPCFLTVLPHGGTGQTTLRNFWVRQNDSFFGVVVDHWPNLPSLQEILGDVEGDWFEINN